MAANSLLLLPGMGADARMFQPQLQAFPELQVPAWIPPEHRETLVHYAERMAESVQLHPDALIGGASFGGVVALEMTAFLSIPKCILIGSLRSPAGLRRSYLRLRSMSGCSTFAPLAARACLGTAGLLCGPTLRGVLRQLAAADGRFLSWAVRALLEWNPSAKIANVSIRQIHGQRDWLLPARISQADLIVPRAGHLLSLTHPHEVNEFINSQIGWSL